MTPPANENRPLGRFDELWNDYLEGEIDDPGLAELNRLLDDSPELVKRAADRYADHRLLGWVLADSNQDAFVIDIAAQLQADSEQFVAGVRERIEAIPSACAVARPTRNRRRELLQVWLPWSLVALAGLVVAVLLADRGQPVAQQQRTVPGPSSSSIAAILVAEVNAKFAEGAGPDAVRFGNGDYALETGVVHLRFTSGADVVIPAPARFSIRDPMHVSLKQGSLRAMVSPAAHGFTVDGPDVCYEDLGTEFGVSVNSARESSDVHIFGGAVDVKSVAGTLLSSLTFGQSAHVAGGQIVGPADPPAPGVYPTPSEVGLLGWQQWRDQIQSDPSLVCYYPFELHEGDRRILKDAHGDIDGRISGARWVSGRWPGKQALLFDRSGDGVELTLPDSYRQFTVTAWIWVDRIDFGLTSVFNSNGYGPGAVHMQFNRARHPYVGIYGNSNVRRVDGEPEHPGVPLGRWVHFAGVVDFDRPWCAIYLDGELADITPFTVPNLVVRPGVCRIGDWGESNDRLNPERGFRGRIDELAIWRRALEPSELRRHVELGRPSLIAADAGR